MNFSELESRNRYLFIKLANDLKMDIQDIDEILNEYISLYISFEEKRFRIIGAKKLEAKKSKRVQFYTYNPKKIILDPDKAATLANLFVTVFKELKLIQDLKDIETSLKKQIEYSKHEDIKSICNDFIIFDN